MSIGPWREPSEESLDLYPGLVVHDGRHSGSITVGRSRLPVQVIVGATLIESWEAVCEDYEIGRYELTFDDLRSFVHCLFEVRGEFARLLLVLANAERLEAEREDEALAPHGPIVNVTPGDPDAVELPPAWWADPDLREPVMVQLRRCLSALKDEETRELFA